GSPGCAGTGPLADHPAPDARRAILAGIPRHSLLLPEATSPCRPNCRGWAGARRSAARASATTAPASRRRSAGGGGASAWSYESVSGIGPALERLVRV